MFARAKPLTEEVVAVHERAQARFSQAADKEAEKVKPIEQPSAAAEELARAMAIHMAAHLAAERRRRARLEEKRRKKLALKRPTLESKMVAVADAACLSAAAHLVRCMRDGQLAMRSTIQMLGAIALVNSLAPLLLAAAAIVVARRIHDTAERDAFRADIDQAKAARSGFSFAGVPRVDRAGYATLIQSSLFETEGSDAGPLITGLGPDNVSAFIAWWAHASDRQRAVVENWNLAKDVDRKSENLAQTAMSGQKDPLIDAVPQHAPKRSRAGKVRSPSRKSVKRSTSRDR